MVRGENYRGEGGVFMKMMGKEWLRGKGVTVRR